MRRNENRRGAETLMHRRSSDRRLCIFTAIPRNLASEVLHGKGGI